MPSFESFEKQVEAKPEAAPQEAPQKPETADKVVFKGLDKITQELQERGVEKENIDAALPIMGSIGYFDRKIFPENPAGFNFVLKDITRGNFAGFIIPEKEEKERSYNIYTKDLAERFKKETSIEMANFDYDGKLKMEKYQDENQFLVSLAAHEVRHRVQRDSDVKMFSPEDAKLVKDQKLANIIEFRDMEFKEREMIFRRDGKSEDFIKAKINPKEFDAEVVEDLVRHKMAEITKGKTGPIKPEYYEEIISIIKMSGPEIKSGKKVEVKETPIDRLKGEIREIALGLQKEGVPVDERARIDISKFGDVYSKRAIESDGAWVKDLKGRWENVAVSNNYRSWEPGPKQSRERVAQENPLGGVWEMLSTKILHQNLGKDFIVTRTSEYDDARYKVDNIVLDRKTGNVVCAFDEIGATSGTRFEEKRSKVLERNWQQGGADLKYGISLEKTGLGKMELKKGSLYQIPLFYFASSQEDIRRALNDPRMEKDIFEKFITSAKGQIKEIGAGPAYPKLKSRLDFFEGVLEKL